MALYSLVFLGSTPVGGPLVGWISQHLTPRYGLAVGGVATLGAGLVTAIQLWRQRTVTEPGLVGILEAEAA
jgi:hypothetical protein